MSTIVICICACVCALSFMCVFVHWQWFTFRDVYMSHVDKTEDHVSKLHREYQDYWNKYGEAIDRGEETVKVIIIL